MLVIVVIIIIVCLMNDSYCLVFILKRKPVWEMHEMSVTSTLPDTQANRSDNWMFQL
jgi:hypothetical protein